MYSPRIRQITAIECPRRIHAPSVSPLSSQFNVGFHFWIVPVPRVFRAT
jgi:hypothetical protein